MTYISELFHSLRHSIFLLTILLLKKLNFLKNLFQRLNKRKTIENN